MAKSLGGWLETAGKLRDGFLVTAGICYFFGYIVWAINAYRDGLGLLPALDFQYFVAGAPTVFTILVLYYLFIGISRLKKVVRDWVNTRPKGWKRFLHWFTLLSGLLAFFTILISSSDWFEAAFPKLAHSSWLTLICALIIIASTLFLPARENAPPKDTRTESTAKQVGLRELFSNIVEPMLQLLGIVYAGMLVIVLVVLAFTYILELYPRIPQELGGARPSYACLDVVKGQISNQTLEHILPTDANKSIEPVVRSLRVEVLFSGSDVMIVRSQGRVYKIAKSTILAVTSCD